VVPRAGFEHGINGYISIIAFLFSSFKLLVPDLLFVSPPTGFYIHRINRNPTITTLEVDAPTLQQSLWLQQLAQERLKQRQYRYSTTLIT
jgi:hypothetical protein